MGDGSRPENGRAMSLESSTLSPSAADRWHGTQTRQSGQAQTLVIVCGFDSHPCYWELRRLGIGEPKWL